MKLPNPNFRSTLFLFLSLALSSVLSAVPETVIQWGPSASIVSRMSFLGEGGGPQNTLPNYGTSPLVYAGDRSLNLERPTSPPMESDTPHQDADDYYTERDDQTADFYAAAFPGGSTLLRVYRITDSIPENGDLDAITVNFRRDGGQNEGIFLVYCLPHGIYRYR